jgi:K+-transporting ATPase KdpF subunit
LSLVRRTSSAAGGCSEAMDMTLESIAGLVIAVLLLAYLVYAMLRPEKF